MLARVVVLLLEYNLSVLYVTVIHCLGCKVNMNNQLSRGDRASCYRGRLLQGHCMQNYHINGEIAHGSSILIHQRNHVETKPSTHANYSRYGQKSLFTPLKLFYASSQLFFYSQSRRMVFKNCNIRAVYNVSQHYMNDASIVASCMCVYAKNMALIWGKLLQISWGTLIQYGTLKMYT